ncbi:hypothetical protein DL89DRAFT_253539 [Linderina pennispora]|uniref:GH15-like domain-containing protein n=1 Tax=Linderina pennispora TaxID=61395 RepID=A0A1Y1WJA7_9FUNG|nr:uncharacterized protein DL89DRAFT_253539 [Linderina pennispora]ORX73573.1 hypothetical protein DL89DRAFT_253539 [Linderina pennispora]
MKVALLLTPIFALAALVSGCTDTTSSASASTSTNSPTPTSTRSSPVRAAVSIWANGQVSIAKSMILANISPSSSASWYFTQASYITGNMTGFWSSSSNIILPTIQYSGGVNKPANIDSQAFLVVLHTALDDGFYTVESDQMLSTFVGTIAKLRPLYAINAATSATIADTTVPIGDTYNGYNPGQQGNPWLLFTSAAAEYSYCLIETWNSAGKSITFTNSISVGSAHPKESAIFTEILNRAYSAGDLYMARAAHHMAADGNMWEEWNCKAGASQGAP